MAFGSFVGMTSQALGWAFLQINKTFVNGRLQKWPKDLRPPWPEHRHHKRAGVWAGGDPMSNLVARGSPCVRPDICLPRLNKACPNPSKWRESLGIRG